MSATLEKVENSEAYLEIIIAAEKFAAGWEKSYKKNAKKYQIPGFRKGSAPRAALEAKFGPNIFLEDAIEIVVPDEYYAAIKELGIIPIGEPDIEVGYVEQGKPVSVKVCVPVKPEVVLGELEGLEIKVPEVPPVTDIEVEKYLQNLQAENKQIVPKVNEPAVMGDTVTFDYRGTVEGTAIGKEEDFKLLLGSGLFFPGFEEHLIGVKQGDKLNVIINFPEDNPAAQLAGKSALFKVKVKKVEDIRLRELDDQFAREIGKAESLEGLRAEGRKRLLEMADQRRSELKRQAAVQALLEKCDVTVPESVVMQRAQSMLEQFSSQLAAQGGNIEMYLQMTNSDPAAFKKQIWEEAKLNLKAEFVLGKIIDEKGFEITEEELMAGIEAFAATLGMEKENAREKIGSLLQKVEFALKAGKAAQYLVDHAVQLSV